MADGRECSLYVNTAILNSSVFSMHQKELLSSAKWQSNDIEFQTEGLLTLKALADNASAVRGTDSSSLSDDLKVMMLKTD